MKLFLFGARPLLFLTAAIFFGLGISLPLMRFEKLWFFIDRPSLIEVIGGLWGEGSLALAAIVTLFSILFPVVKLAVGFQSIARAKSLPGWTVILAKWSMMDVLLVAIVVFAAKTSGLASAVAEPGVWFYALSSVLAAIGSYGVETRNADNKPLQSD